MFVLDPCKRLRTNENRGGCQVGLRAKSHGVLGRVEWYGSGMVRVHRMVCGEEGATGFLGGKFVVTTAAPTTTATQVRKPSAPRKRRGVVIQDPKEKAASVIVHSEDIAKKQRMDEEEEELKRHLQIMANDDDDVYTEATLLASKVPVVDYQIHHENNKPYYKKIRADRTHKLFLSFITLLKNFDREDIEAFWKLVKERFETTEPKNFSDDFFLNILKIMFDKPNIETSVWKDQKGRYGLAKLITEVVTTAAPTTTATQVRKPSAPRKRRGVVIQDPKEKAASVIVHSEDIAKKQRMDEEEEELKRHLQIMANDDDDVYTEAPLLASKVPVVDYQIHHENNKPYYKKIRADRTHKLFLSFITLLKNFDREDIEAFWKLVKERFETTEPKNFSDDFFLNILKIMFDKPNIETSVWKDQKGRYGLAKVKSWKLFESCGVHVITLTTTQMFLLVEKKYPLTHFTLHQMLDNVRLEVKEECEMSLELLRLVRRQLNEGYKPDGSVRMIPLVMVTSLTEET
nr:hypothetical protein [Tanacetum cinerariifolium]